MKLTLRQLFPYLVALLGVLITLAGTGLFIASFSQPAFRMPAVGIHLAGWGVLLLGFRLVSLQTKQYQQVPLPQEPSLPEDYLPIGEVPLQTPRTVHFRPSIRFARWFLLLLLLVRLGHSLWYGSVDISELNALQKHGQATQAQVINNVALAGYANYAFRVNATAMVSSFPVPPSEAKNYPLGKYLPLVYLPDNPQIYRLGTVNAEVIRGQMGGWFLLGLQGLLVIGLPFLLLERRWQREMRLARDGSIATGQVTESNPVSVGGRTTAYDITYSFVSGEGTPQTGQARLKPEQGENFPKGNPITILYTPAQPTNHRPGMALGYVQFAGTTKPKPRSERYD